MDLGSCRDKDLRPLPCVGIPVWRGVIAPSRLLSAILLHGFTTACMRLSQAVRVLAK